MTKPRSTRTSRTRKVAKERRVRRPMSELQVEMSVDPQTLDNLKSKKLVPHIFNDQKGKIERAIQNGWTFVSSTSHEAIKVGDEGIVKSPNEHICWEVGKHRNGEPKYAYLMALPEKWHKEDKETKEERNRMVDAQLQVGKFDGVENHNVPSNKGHTSVSKLHYQP